MPLYGTFDLLNNKFRVFIFLNGIPWALDFCYITFGRMVLVGMTFRLIYFLMNVSFHHLYVCNYLLCYAATDVKSKRLWILFIGKLLFCFQDICRVKIERLIEVNQCKNLLMLLLYIYEDATQLRVLVVFLK